MEGRLNFIKKTQILGSKDSKKFANFSFYCLNFFLYSAFKISKNNINLLFRVERVEVKDVRLPEQLQRAMAAEAEATRQARAKVIEAEGEQKASRALKEASDIISSSGAALQLRQEIFIFLTLLIIII